MDNKRLEDKLDKMAEDISAIKQTMAVNTASLEVHIKRTDLAEERMDGVDAKIAPLERHVDFVKGIVWSLGIVGSIVLGCKSLGLF